MIQHFYTPLQFYKLKIIITFLLLSTSALLKAQSLDIQIDPDLSLNYNSYLAFQVLLEDDQKEIKSTFAKKRKHRIKWSDIDVKLTGASYLEKGLLKVYSGEKLKEQGEITLHVTYEGLTVSKTIALKFDDIQIVNFNGKNAKKRRPNRFLGSITRGFFNAIITEATGVEITPVPRKGKPGRNGSNAGMVIVTLDTVRINQQTILKVTCVDKTHHKQAIAYTNPTTGQIKIMAEGGRGGRGTRGERYNPSIHGSGGKSARGGNGGRAGAGGYVEVYVDSSTQPYINALIITTEGGFGGSKGASYRRPNLATNGLNGNHGNVVFVNKESLEAPASSKAQK